MTPSRRPSVALLALLAACQVTPPGKLERAAAAAVKRHVTVRGASDVNPLSATAAEIAKGQVAFSSYCEVCHGLDGHGTGVPLATAVYPPVADLGAPEVQAYTDGQLRWVVRNGLAPSGMPAARGILNDDEIWRIVLYIRHLPPAGSLGELAVYGGPGR